MVGVGVGASLAITGGRGGEAGEPDGGHAPDTGVAVGAADVRLERDAVDDEERARPQPHEPTIRAHDVVVRAADSSRRVLTKWPGTAAAVAPQQKKSRFAIAGQPPPMRRCLGPSCRRLLPMRRRL